MIPSNPLRNAVHAIPVAVLSLFLLSAGMCSPAEEPAPEETAATQPDSPAAAEPQPFAADEAADEADEQQRLAALAAAERQLVERQAQLAEEENRLAERERQRAAREDELLQQQAELERRQEEVAAREPVVTDQTAPEPLPEPTGSYEGDFDEPWRESQATADAEPPPADDNRGAEIDRQPAPPAAPKASLAAGQRLEVQIRETLSSETARVGDTFSTLLVGDLRDDSGTLAVPAGAKVIGRVTEASPYRGGGGPATLGVEFTDIVVSPDQTVGIRASFVELGADRRKNRKKVVAGAVVGAILGHILGGDGSKNVIIGAAAGAAAGGAIVARARDRDAEIPAGQIIALQLEEVVTVEVEYGAVAGR
jgi:hypothetical protein